MKLDIGRVITNFEGKAIKDSFGISEDKIQKDLTLGGACINSLLYIQDEKPISGQEKLDRYELALKIKVALGTDKKEADLKIEEIAKIKELVGKFYNTLVVGQVFKLIEEKN